MNSKLPPEAKQIDKELRQIQKQKEESVRDQNFDQAGQLREKEIELSAKIKEVLDNKKVSTNMAFEARLHNQALQKTLLSFFLGLLCTCHQL